MPLKRARIDDGLLIEDQPVIEEDIEMPLCEREEGEVTAPPAWPVLMTPQATSQMVLTYVAVTRHLQLQEESEEQDVDDDQFFDAMSFEEEMFSEEEQKEEECFEDALYHAHWMVLGTPEEMSILCNQDVIAEANAADVRPLTNLTREAPTVMPAQYCLPDRSPDEMEMGFDLAELLYGLTLVEPQADRGASPETNAHEQHPPAPSSDPQPTESEPEDQIMISRNNRRPMRFREICGAGRSVQQRRVESPAEPAQPVRTTSRPASKSAQPSARPKPHLKPPR